MPRNGNSSTTESATELKIEWRLSGRSRDVMLDVKWIDGDAMSRFFFTYANDIMLMKT